MSRASKQITASLKDSLLVFFGAVSISFGPLCVKSVQAGATAAAFYRMLFGALALLLIAAIRRQTLLPSKSAFFFIVLAGAAFSGDLFFWHRSIHLVGPGLSTILANFQVFILAALGVLFFNERLSLRLAVSIAMAFSGLVMLLELDFKNMSPSLVYGVAYGLLTACFLSVYLLSLRQTRKVSAPLGLVSNMALVSLTTASILAIILYLEGGSWGLASGRDACLLAVYGIGCQAVGWLMVSAGLPGLSPGRGGLLLMAEPLFAFIWDILLLGRPTGPIGYIGASFTIFAIYFCLAGKKNS